MLITAYLFGEQCMKKVLFIGDINVDVMMGGLESFPQKDREITCTSFEITMGSPAVICACAYASLGGNASFLGLAGNDDYGDFMKKEMKDFNITTDLVSRTDKVRTGVTVNLIYENTRTQVTYPGTIAELNGSHVDTSKLVQFDHIHCAGPYLQTRFISEITHLLTFAREKNITISLDPQWDTEEKWNYIEEWLPLLTYLFVNTDEALSITKASSLKEACGKLVQKIHCPLVKAGKDGVYVYKEGAMKLIPAPNVEVLDTTGAGDSFAGGFLFASLEKKMNLYDAAVFANAVAARSCTFTGGTNARSTYEDIITFMGE